jgi:adenosylcobinamide-GDP ribazoletransferase
MQHWLEVLRAAISFLTRLPVGNRMPSPEVLRAAPALFPIIGGAIGAFLGAFYFVLISCHIANFVAAALTVGASAMVTGALHEDGLADTADGFGGGRDVSAKLEIMRDSRIGTYGAVALLVWFFAKVGAIATLPIETVIPILAAAYAMGRGALPVLSFLLPYARADGLAATAGRPTLRTVFVAIATSVVIAVLALGVTGALITSAVVAAGAAVISLLAMHQIGGQTGDVLGATEQIAETAAIVVLASYYS